MFVKKSNRYLVQSEPCSFGIRIAQQAVKALVFRITGLFVTTERLRHIAFFKAVDKERTTFNFTDKAHGSAVIVGPDTAL